MVVAPKTSNSVQYVANTYHIVGKVRQTPADISMKMRLLSKEV